MSIEAHLHTRDELRRFGIDPDARPLGVIDERLASALCDMTIDELRSVQASLYRLGRVSRPPAAQIAKAVEGQSKDIGAWLRFRETRDDATKVMMLLGAVAVGIAWWTYRSKPAPWRSIHQAIASVDDGHPYLLPIPRSEPCFCGSGTKFKCCHGRPPSAAPSMTA